MVKLLLVESESETLRRWLAGHPTWASCELARVEVVRAVRPHRPAVSRARELLSLFRLVALGGPLLDDAAELADQRLRSLDAIHLAAARTLGGELGELVTYDHRMTTAAERLGMTVAAPGRAP